MHNLMIQKTLNIEKRFHLQIHTMNNMYPEKWYVPHLRLLLLEYIFKIFIIISEILFALVGEPI